MRRLATALCLVLLGGLSAAPSWAQSETPVKWTATPPTGEVRPSEPFELRIGAEISGNWHLYSATQPPGGPVPTRFSIISGDPFRISGTLRQSKPTTEFDPNFQINTEYFSGTADFWLTLQAVTGTKAGEYPVRLQVVYMVCNDQMCLPPTKVPIPVTIRVAESGAVRAGSAAQDPVAAAPSAAESASQEASAATSTPATQSGTEPPALSVAGTQAEVQEARSRGFLPFLWLAMTMGAISLATPCVFPMIPITVSYFTKAAETGKSSGLSQALVYCFGIIFTFTGLGLGLAALLGATGINQFAANPWVNLLITAIFLIFALNLFGLFQIGVPSSVLTRLANVGGKGGYVQALLMGLTFTLTSFTCTVPFVGTVLVATSQGEWLWPALGMLAFSVVFAVPFFALALIPRLLTSLPRSGGWLNSVKVTMGFLEVAAAMKFISNVDLVWNWHIFTREVVLAIWLAIAVLAALYLLGNFRLPHDTPVESLGVARMLSAMAFLAVGFFLFTGLLGGSLGELDAFLPPRTSGTLNLTGGGGSRGEELTWHTNLNAALAEARQQQKPVFIDFTGYTCTNCRWMESNIFPAPEIQSELRRYVRVQLFTDGAGKTYEENQQYQKEKFGSVALPLYVILDAQGNKVAVFPGMTRKKEEFLRFLRTPVPAPAI